MIECELQPFIGENERVHYGIYLHSLFYSIKGYGKKKWAVAVNIDLDYEAAAAEHADDQIVRECIEFLNAPPKSKYGKRRKRKPLYGVIHEEPYRYYVKEKNNKKYIQAFLIIEERKSNKFRGKGPKI